jgi:hypothetical protein
MQINPLASISVQQLKRALPIKLQIEALEDELAKVLNAKASVPSKDQAPMKRTLSKTTKAKISAAQTARWAERKKLVAPIEPPAKMKRKISPEGRARNIAATKARWARYRAEKKKAKAA